jgi:hypothetical protein
MMARKRRILTKMKVGRKEKQEGKRKMSRWLMKLNKKLPKESYF